MPTHTVAAGESIVQLSERYGLFSLTIWNDPANAELRSRRTNMNVLAPGDEVFIPEKRIVRRSVATGRRHVFRRRGIPAVLRLRLLVNDQPRAQQDYVLTVDGRKIRGTTDADGMLAEWIPAGATGGSLVIGPDQYQVRFQIGRLDPVTERSGAAARLRNLGYLLPDAIEDDAALSEAVRRFQEEQQLAMTGDLDDATRARLVMAHDGSAS